MKRQYRVEEIDGKWHLLVYVLRECGILMDYLGGFGEWGDKGREAMGAAAVARQWAEEMGAVE